MTKAPYRLFEVAGLELEYPIVDAELTVRCWVEEAFRRLHGRPTSDVELDRVGFSNELAAHVFEIKTLEPRASLAEAEADLVAGVRRFSALLAELGGRLLPTGMHPFMHPSEAQLWPRAGRRIYATYARVFDLSGHGWVNVQSCHLNLPFGTEEETVRLHNATAALLPYLPALAASSPVYEGALGPAVDNRLAFYRNNQARVPQLTGRVIPEYVDSFSDYRAKILRPIYRALAEIPEAEGLRHEWVNSRGAILRFWRDAIEIRVVDAQECVKMDAAIAAFARATLRFMVDALSDGSLTLPAHDVLVSDFDRVVAAGTAAEVEAPHLRDGRGPVPAGELLRSLLERSADRLLPDERPYLPLLRARAAGGNLSERIRARLEASPKAKRKQAIRGVYEELADCLLDNRPWEG